MHTYTSRCRFLRARVIVGLQMAAVVDEVYPSRYASFVTKLKFVNLDIGLLLSHSCVVRINFYDRLLLSTITPFLVVSALVATYSIANRRNNGSEAKGTQDSWHGYMSTASFVAFFVYSTVSFTILQTFVCDTVDDTSFLRADYSISCDTRAYLNYRAYAVLMIWVYPIGVPAVSTWWLLRNRKELANPSRATVAHLEPLSQIWACYRPSRYYYELVEFTRRAALTTAAVFIVPNSLVQISVVLLLAAVFLLVSASMDPFNSTVDMNLNLWGNGIILASMYLALLMKVNMVDEDESLSLMTFQNVLVAANIFMVVTVLVHTAVALHDMISTARVIELPPIRRST